MFLGDFRVAGDSGMRGDKRVYGDISNCRQLDVSKVIPPTPSRILGYRGPIAQQSQIPVVLAPRKCALSASFRFHDRPAQDPSCAACRAAASTPHSPRVVAPRTLARLLRPAQRRHATSPYDRAKSTNGSLRRLRAEIDLCAASGCRFETTATNGSVSTDVQAIHRSRIAQKPHIDGAVA